jgi:voltage-gated potassium channel Kch
MRLLKLYQALFSAIFAALRAPQVKALMVFCLLISGLQAIVFSVVEGWSLLDGLYFAVVTMATVGYGDLAPQTGFGKLAAVAFMFVGIGIFVLTFSALAQEFLREVARASTPKPESDLRAEVASAPGTEVHTDRLEAADASGCENSP